MSTKESGTVKWFDARKGFGFAVNAAGEGVLIVHREMPNALRKVLREGDAISCTQVKSEKG